MEHYRPLRLFLNKFLSLSDEDFGKLQQRSKLFQFAGKTTIPAAGDSELYLYFVVKGLIPEFFY
ncbi:MAG: hypothetical protein FJY20_02365 [Bacteroidetes bacterium]|nr:hypothetical protein [Bacteroidota bacterium]